MNIKKIKTSIPYIELSVKVDSDAVLEKSILTPFGMVDIIIEKIERDDTSNKCFYEIRIKGDTDKWLYDEELHKEFKSFLIGFLRDLATEDICKCEEKSVTIKLIMKFKQSEILVGTQVN